MIWKVSVEYTLKDALSAYKKAFRHPSKSTTKISLLGSDLSKPTKCVAVSVAISAALLLSKVFASSPPENMLGPPSIPPNVRYLSNTFFRSEFRFRFAT